jgi:hypothetical protein
MSPVTKLNPPLIPILKIHSQKVNIVLEELGVSYNVHKIELSKNVQKEPWYLEINPNGRIPAIVDKTGGRNKRVFEGAAIMLYLCAKYDKDYKISFEYDSDEYWEMMEWLVWMQSGTLRRCAYLSWILFSDVLDFLFYFVDINSLIEVRYWADSRQVKSQLAKLDT